MTRDNDLIAMEEIRFEPGDEPEVLVCTSHECERGSHHECKGVLWVDPATGDLDPAWSKYSNL